MRISYQQAANIFAAVEPAYQMATLSPAYVLIDSERNTDLEPIFWAYREASATFYHGFHLATIPGTNYRDVQSPYSYGGPFSNTCDQGFLQRAWQAYKTWCRENRVVAEFIRFHPLRGNWEFYAGEIVADRMTVWIGLGVTDLLAAYDTRVRTAIRKATKNGLSVEWSTGPENSPLFAKLYCDAMRKISAHPFYLFPESYFRRLLQWEHAKLAVCTRAGEILGAAIFLFGSQVVEYHLSAVTAVAKHLGAANLILHEAAQLARSLGCRVLYLGGGTDGSPDNPLLFFKAGFSANRAEFRFGRHVHCPAAYSDLQQRFAAEYHARPDRVLFYR